MSPYEEKVKALEAVNRTIEILKAAQNDKIVTSACPHIEDSALLSAIRTAQAITEWMRNYRGEPIHIQTRDPKPQNRDPYAEIPQGFLGRLGEFLEEEK